METTLGVLRYDSLKGSVGCVAVITCYILLYVMRGNNIQYIGVCVFSLKSKFFLYHEACYPKKLEKYSQKMLATPIFWKELKFYIFSNY